MQLFKWWKNIFKKEEKLFPHEVNFERKKMDTDKIRLRITSLGWMVREIPVRKKRTTDILEWRLIAVRHDKSVDVSGKTLDESFVNLGKTLGVISDRDILR